MRDDEKRRFAIMRWINYKNTSLEGFEKARQYICNPESSPDKWQQYSCLHADRAMRDLEVIERRWHDEIKGRLYKHAIISFGVPDMEPKEAFAVMEDILSLYRGKFPYLFGIHTNIPSRIHAHCLMGMTNLQNGKRFEQSPQELRRFQEHCNNVLEAFGLPLLKGKNQKAISDSELPSDDGKIAAEIEARASPNKESSVVYTEDYVEPISACDDNYNQIYYGGMTMMNEYWRNPNPTVTYPNESTSYDNAPVQVMKPRQNIAQSNCGICNDNVAYIVNIDVNEMMKTQAEMIIEAYERGFARGKGAVNNDK